jgi:histidinol-phosphate aminotransferase
MRVEDLVRPSVLERKDYVPGKPAEEVQRELGLKDIAKLASNENPLGTSDLAVEAMVTELRERANRYPEGLCPRLIARLSEIHDVEAACLYVGNGADGVLSTLGLTFLNPGDEVVLGEVTFPVYENIVTLMGGTCVRVPLTDDLRLDLPAMVAAVTQRTKMLFLCNPNNPTGTIVHAAEVERALGALPDSVLVVSDEAYYDFVDDPRFPDSIRYLRTYRNLIVLRTFSKTAGLAGLRIGYAIADPDVVRMMLKTREPFPVNRIAQAGALASLDDVEFTKRSIEIVRNGKRKLYQALAELGVKFYPSQANFVFVDLGRPSAPVFEKMLRAGVIVRPLTFAGVPNGLRITVGLESDNVRTIAALRKALEAN